MQGCGPMPERGASKQKIKNTRPNVTRCNLAGIGVLILEPLNTVYGNNVAMFQKGKKMAKK